MLSRTGLRMYVLVVVQIFAESTWRLSRAWTLLLIRCSDNSSLPLNVKIAVLVAVPELFLTPESVQPLFRVHRIGSSARPPETVVNMVALELVATSGNVDGPDAWICIYAHTVTWPRSRADQVANFRLFSWEQPQQVSGKINESARLQGITLCRTFNNATQTMLKHHPV